MISFHRQEMPVEVPDESLAPGIADVISAYGYNSRKPAAEVSEDPSSSVDSPDIRTSMIPPARQSDADKQPNYVAQYSPPLKSEPRPREAKASYDSRIFTERLGGKTYSGETVSELLAISRASREADAAEETEAADTESGSAEKFTLKSLFRAVPLKKNLNRLSEARQTAAESFTMPEINLRAAADHLRQAAAEAKGKTVRRARVSAALGAVVLSNSASLEAARQKTAGLLSVPEFDLRRRTDFIKDRIAEIKDSSKTKHASEAAIAVLAIGAAATLSVLAAKSIISNFQPDTVSNALPNSTPKAPAAHLETATSFDAVHQAMIAMRVTSFHHVAHAVQKYKEYKEALSFSGDNVWNHVSAHLQAKLGHMPSNELIRNVTGKVLKENHWSWAKATHLPKGTIVHISEKLLR